MLELLLRRWHIHIECDLQRMKALVSDEAEVVPPPGQ